MKVKSVMEKYNLLSVQVRASLWFLICSFVQKGLSMITTPIFTRMLSTDEYGQYGAYNSWLGIITIFVSMNMFYGVHSQGIVKFSDDRGAFTSSLEGLTTVLVFSWTFIYLLFKDFWNAIFSITTIQMLAMMLTIWASGIYNFWANEKRVTYSYKELVTITLIVSVMKSVIEIILIFFSKDKVTAMILGWVIVDLIGYSWMYLYQIRINKTFFSKRIWKYAILFNLPLVPHYLSQTILSSADRIMIQKMVGDSEAGIYSLAYSLALLMTLFNTALMQTISPWIYIKIKEKKIYEISSIAYISLLFVAVMNLILILLAPEAVIIFAPKSYYEAIWVIPPVAMSAFFMYSYDLFAKFAFYYEKTRFIMCASAVGAILNVVLNYCFINQFGYMAAGYTTLICYMLYSLLHYLFMKRICNQCADGKNPYEIKKLLLITGPFLALGFCFLFTYKHPIIRYGILLCVIIILVFKKQLIINDIKKIFNLKNRR